MTKLTQKQQKFVEAKAHGLGNTQAATVAGYAANSAAVTATQLSKRPEIVKAIAALRRKMGKPEQEQAPKRSSDAESMRRSFGSSLELMQAAYNDINLPFGVRFEAAKQALPYEHAKVGEKGKKESRKDAAKEVAGRGRFTPKAPPSSHLSLVK